MVASPANITNLISQPTQVLVTGVHGAATITVANPYLVDVSTPVVNGSSIAFTLTEVAGGNTTVTVTDATNASVTILVNGVLCVPPTPNVTLLGESVAIATPSPAPGQPQQAATTTYIYFGSPYALAMRARLVASDGTIVEGTQTFPVAGSAVAPPSPIPSLQPGYILYYSALRPLSAGLTYQIQLVIGCAPVFVVGSFST